MNRRSFFSNLVAAVSTLVAIYSTPLSLINRKTCFADILIRESGRFIKDSLELRTFKKSVWTGLIKRGPWPEGMGETIRAVTYERDGRTREMITRWSNSIQDA
jgi:hypothetical protein